MSCLSIRDRAYAETKQQQTSDILQPSTSLSPAEMCHSAAYRTTNAPAAQASKTIPPKPSIWSVPIGNNAFKAAAPEVAEVCSTFISSCSNSVKGSKHDNAAHSAKDLLDFELDWLISCHLR